MSVSGPANLGSPLEKSDPLQAIAGFCNQPNIGIQRNRYCGVIL